MTPEEFHKDIRRLKLDMTAKVGETYFIMEYYESENWLKIAEFKRVGTYEVEQLWFEKSEYDEKKINLYNSKPNCYGYCYMAKIPPKEERKKLTKEDWERLLIEIEKGI